MIQTVKASHPHGSSENEDMKRPEQVSDLDFRLGTREKIAFTILMIMSFYAALESTGMGVALLVTLLPDPTLL
jgi:hypothetical protein